jgi:hypothetical protein
MTTSPSELSGPRSSERNLKDTTRSLTSWASGSMALIFVYALAFSSEGAGEVVSIFTHGTLIGIAFGSVGCLVGFLFGIPRTLQSDAPSPSTAGGSGKQNAQSDGYRQAVNTNLEQISDWLTKILVGVGLTQLQEIPNKLMRLANYFQSGLHSNAPVALAIILNSMVFGFFAGYLLTRLFLAGAFSEADRTAATLLGAEQFAQGLTEAGAYRKAISTLETALRQVGPDTPKDVKRKIYESLAYNYLYEEPPLGFQKVIEYGTAYVTQEPNNASARISCYLAAAYGQLYSWELTHEKRKEVLDGARKSALDAVQNALKLEPKIKPLLTALWDPNDATKEPTQENDLEVFYTDPDFAKLLA